MSYIYKVFLPTEFAQFQKDKSSKGTPLDLKDGFIHMSTASELGITVDKYYLNIDSIILVAIDIVKTKDDTKWEYVESRKAEFPHLFRPLSLDDMVWSREVKLIDGKHDCGDLTKA